MAKHCNIRASLRSYVWVAAFVDGAISQVGHLGLITYTLGLELWTIVALEFEASACLEQRRLCAWTFRKKRKYGTISHDQ